MSTWAVLAAGIIAISTSGCFSARGFIADKTQLELTSDVGVCSQSVVDYKTCEPGMTGGAPWVRNVNFDTFAPTEDTYQDKMGAIRLRYLGTPYWNGSIHLECKSKVKAADLPTETALLDDIDLASTLQKTTVDEVAIKAIMKLRARGVNLSADVQAAFKSSLSETVGKKVGARYLWFLTKWTGGRDSIAKNPALAQCVADVTGKKHASLVTGVAGLLVLTNKVDTSVSSESTILTALSAHVAGQYSAQLAAVQADISAEWKHSVEKNFTVNGNMGSLTSTVYPLWVQFE